MKLAKGLQANNLIAFPDPKLASYRKQIRSLKRQLRYTESNLDAITLQLQTLRKQHRQLEQEFDAKLTEKIISHSDLRVRILESQLEEAIKLATHFKEIILERPLIPVSVAIGQHHKAEAHRQAQLEQMRKNETSQRSS